MREIEDVAGEGIVADDDGAMLHDQLLAADATIEWLDRNWWIDRGEARDLAGGRGGVALVAAPIGECVLRHYRRGGMVARVLGDRYRWRGADRTRSFAEFRLLRRLTAMGLPVPQAVAAGYHRRGRYYTADILTRLIAGAQTLAHIIADAGLDDALASRVGAVIARFHRAGVDHADLNAHNILINADGIHLIDFDRGRMRAPARGWQQANLRRLRRSLLKLGAAGADTAALDAELWPALLRGWQAEIVR